MNVPDATDNGARAVSLNDLLAVWPRRVQITVVALLLVAISLMAGHVVLGGLRDARPTDVERNAFSTAPVELNRADKALLRQLPDVGDQLADRIIQHRQDRGPFRNVNDLEEVPGIGKTKLERLRTWVYVEEAEETPTKGAKPAGAVPPRAKKGEGVSVPIDLNEATAEELQKIPGIGAVRSATIIQARKAKAFESVEDLRRVPGIGPKTLESIRPYVTVTKKRST
jgi:competence protein ComEA